MGSESSTVGECHEKNPYKMATYSYVIAPLYHSTICRICGTDNSEGIYLYETENEMDLKTVINRYLPIKIDDDGKLPRTICPGCHIQLASTMQFFNLIVDGQARLRELWSHEVSMQKSLEREKQLLVETLEGNPKISLVTEDVTNENDILIKIFPDDPYFGPEHEMTLLVEGLNKPKRKRGRPRKPKIEEGDVSQQTDTDTTAQSLEAEYLLEEPKEEDEDQAGDEGARRLRRRRKPPQRFMEAVAGKELERILREEGAIDEYESEANPQEEGMSSIPERDVSEPDTGEGNAAVGEIIGHLQTPDGEIAEPILAHSSGRSAYRRKRINRFVCDFCQQTFKDRTRWIRHRLTHKGFSFQCSESSCLETFSSHSKLRVHQAVREHQGMEIVGADSGATLEEPDQLLCVVCGHITATTAELATHIETEHPLSKVDNITANKLEVGEVLREEDKTDTELLEDTEETEPIEAESKAGSRTGAWQRNSLGKFKCDMCKRTFNHTSSLLYHKESFHNNGIRFACSKCPKTFSHKQLLQRHQMVHSDSRPFTCNKCGVGFKTKSNLFNHRVVHTGEKKFSCTTCGQMFAHKTSLNLHTIWHQGIRPYKCPLCAKCFTQNGNLNEHLRIHYGEKPYNCSYCDKSFTTSSQHKLHIKRHTGERPWKCQYCSKQFLHKDTWRTHERRHTGEKPFACSYCQRAFSEHWSLKKHIRLHTGEKPYKCDVCGKDFADCSNLTKHKKVHGVVSTANGDPIWKADDEIRADGDGQQIVYIYDNQEGEDQSCSQTFSLEQHTPLDDTMCEDASVAGQVTTFTDEEGNPVQLPLPGGRSVEILSLDMETNIVQVRTSEGWTILLQLSQKHNIADEELLEQIREAVAAAKPLSANELEETAKIEPQPTRQNVKSKKAKNVAMSPTTPLNNMREIKLDELGRAFLVPENSESTSDKDTKDLDQQSFSIRIDKSMGMSGDFGMDTLKNVYLVAD